MTLLYVITNADFPAGVVSSREVAESIVKRHNKAERAARNDPLSGYWRVFEFTLDGYVAPPNLSHAYKL